MSLIPANHNFTIYQGATFLQRITILEGAPGSNPRDLNDCTAVCEIKDQRAGEVLLTLSTENGDIELGGDNGTIDLIIEATDTDLITWDVGYYDLAVTTASDHTDVILLGTFTVIHL